MPILLMLAILAALVAFWSIEYWRNPATIMDRRRRQIEKALQAFRGAIPIMAEIIREATIEFQKLIEHFAELRRDD